MSTRASVVVSDGRDKLYFYQQSDGYPEGLGETLRGFLASKKAKEYLGDIEYFAGLLLIEVNRDYYERNLSLPSLVPAVEVHGDEQYQYIIDCNDLTLETKNL